MFEAWDYRVVEAWDRNVGAVSLYRFAVERFILGYYFADYEDVRT